MEMGTSPCPRAAAACRNGCRAPACTSLPVRSPGLPAPPGNPQQSTGMATQSRRWPCASLFCFSAVKRPGPIGMQGFASVPGLPGALPWCGVLRAACRPRRHGWEGLGVLGIPARTIRAMPVPSCWRCRGSGAGTGAGASGHCRRQHLFAHPQGCGGSGVGSGPETAAPGAALPGQG